MFYKKVYKQKIIFLKNSCYYSSIYLSNLLAYLPTYL